MNFVKAALPVTASLSIALAAMLSGAAPIPSFSLQASDGHRYSTAALATGKPTIVIFLSAGCPHNPPGIRDMNRLVAELHGRVRVVGMTNLDPSRTRQFARKYGARFPVISDTDGKVIEAFGAKAGLDTAVVTPGGGLTETWTGYSRGTLRKLFADIAEHGGPKLDVDLSAFPKDRQSGCMFMQM